MELRQLSHFVAVAEEESFTRAAKRMHIVQSGIWSSVRALEEEVGVALLRREKGKVDLTEAGRALLVQARHALRSVADGVNAARSANGPLDAGTLNIATSSPMPARLELNRVIDDFHVRHPNIAIGVREMARRSFDELHTGETDVVIIGGHGPPGVTSIELDQSKLVVVCRAGHRFARRHCVSLEDVAEEPFVDVTEGSLSRTLVDRAFVDAGLQRRTVITASGALVLLGLISQGIGVSLLPEFLVDLSPGVRGVHLCKSIGSWPVTVSYLGDQPANPAARAFVESLRRRVTET